jgi:hypothetical protein
VGRLAAPAFHAAPAGSPESVATPCPGGRAVSVSERGSRDLVAGFLCAFSLALSGIALTRTPGLLATTAIVIALVALRMSQARHTLASVAVLVAGCAFFLGMIIAVVTASPLY